MVVLALAALPFAAMLLAAALPETANGVWTVMHRTDKNGMPIDNSIDIEFMPDKDNVNCPRIGFAQTVKAIYIDAAGKKMVLRPSEDNPKYAFQDDDTLDDGTMVDHVFCETDGYYNGDDVPQDHATDGPTGQGAAKGDGSATTPATMKDTPRKSDPFFPTGKTKVQYEFETCAICIQGTEGGDAAGTSYGCVKWTYQRTKGDADNGMVALPTKVEDQTKPHQDALKKFNDNHAGTPPMCPEDIPAGNCANRVYNKKGPLIFHVNDDYSVRAAGAGLTSAGEVTAGSIPPSGNFKPLAAGDSLKKCDYVLVPKGETICIRRKSQLQEPIPEIPFFATFADLLTGAIETVESSSCTAAEHCGVMARDCSGRIKFAAVAPIDTGDPEALVMYTAEVDPVNDRVVFRNDPLSSGALISADILRSSTGSTILQPGDSIAYDYPGLIPDCVTFKDCNDNGVDDPEDISSGASEDFNQNGIPDECEKIPSSSWELVGTAEGGEVQVTVEGLFGTCFVTVPTSAAQSNEAVAENLAAALNASTCLTDQRIIATATGGTVRISGLGFVSAILHSLDPGIEHAFPRIPFLSHPLLMLLAVLILIGGVYWVLRKS